MSIQLTPKMVPMAVVIDWTDEVRAVGSGMFSMPVTEVTSSWIGIKKHFENIVSYR